MRLIVVVGPTACGKTRLGVEVAHALGTAIVSADSRQVYRGLDIGSGKDLDEYRRVSPPVPYHLIDVADPLEIYSVFHYQRDVYRVLAGHRGERPLVMVGGTGLYVEAVLRGYRIANVPEDEALRERLMRRDLAELVGELRGSDPELAGRTDCRSKKRVVRALEIAAHARHRPVSYSPPPPVALEPAVFVVESDREQLHRRIALRLDERLGQGLVEEVESLLAAGVPRDRMMRFGLEYREVALYLEGAKSHQQMRDDLCEAIRRFSKRQRTWFRGFSRRGIDATWIRADDAETILRGQT